MKSSWIALTSQISAKRSRSELGCVRQQHDAARSGDHRALHRGSFERGLGQASAAQRVRANERHVGAETSEEVLAGSPTAVSEPARLAPPKIYDADRVGRRQGLADTEVVGDGGERQLSLDAPARRGKHGRAAVEDHALTRTQRVRLRPANSLLLGPIELGRDRRFRLEGGLELLLDQRAAMRAFQIARSSRCSRSRRTVEVEMPIASASSWIDAAPRLRICSSMKARRWAGMNSGRRVGVMAGSLSARGVRSVDEKHEEDHRTISARRTASNLGAAKRRPCLISTIGTAARGRLATGPLSNTVIP